MAKLKRLMHVDEKWRRVPGGRHREREKGKSQDGPCASDACSAGVILTSAHAAHSGSLQWEVDPCANIFSSLLPGLLNHWLRMIRISEGPVEDTLMNRAESSRTPVTSIHTGVGTLPEFLVQRLCFILTSHDVLRLFWRRTRRRPKCQAHHQRALRQGLPVPQRARRTPAPYVAPHLVCLRNADTDLKASSERKIWIRL